MDSTLEKPIPLREVVSRRDSPQRINGQRNFAESSKNITAKQPVLAEAFTLCLNKTHRNIKHLADSPKAGAWAVDGNYFKHQQDFFEIGNWTSSFFTGMALLAWQKTEDEFYINQVLRLAPCYREKVFKHQLDTTHDLGFLYSLYSMALYKLTGDRQHRTVGLQAAKLLADRFNPSGRYIRAWGRINDQNSMTSGVAAISSLMNLPLLLWAWAETDRVRFLRAAMWHADTILEHFVRKDDSVFAACRLDETPQTPCNMDNYGGCSLDSHWARGTAWTIYGFALAGRHLGRRVYYDASLRLLNKFVESLDKEMIPLWDFKLPAQEKPLRDSSAAAVVICAIQKLEAMIGVSQNVAQAKISLLNELCVGYLNYDESCPGILRGGHICSRTGTSQNAYTSWGDYFLMEALARELFDLDTFW